MGPHSRDLFRLVAALFLLPGFGGCAQKEAPGTAPPLGQLLQAERDDDDRACGRDDDDDRDSGDDEHGRGDDRTAQTRPLDIPLPGIQSSVWPDGSVALAIPLHNTTKDLIDRVKVTDIRMSQSRRLAPASFPISLGDFVPDDIKSIDARFKVPRQGGRLLVRVAGTYGKHGCRFHARAFVTPQQNPSGPVPAIAGTIQKNSAGNAVFPPSPPPPPPEREFNAVGFLPPPGPPRDLFPGPPGSTGLAQAQAGPRNAQGPMDVVFTRNTLGATYGGFPPDPTVAGNNADDVVMFAANTAVSYSTDGGLHFNTVNLFGTVDPKNPARNGFFPQDDGGLCCDMVLTYLPNQNLFVWLLQYWPLQTGTDAAGNPITTTNRLRIAWATPQDIKNNFLYAWTWVDLTSAGVGIGNDWMDFPDMAFSDNFLYVGVDHAIQNTGSVYLGRHIFARLSLHDIADPSIPSVGYQYMDPTYGGLYQNHIVQSSRDGFYWSAMPNTSTLTVWSWPDALNFAVPHDIPITSYSNSDYSAKTPEGIDWNAAPKLALGATRVAPFFFCPDGCSGPTRFLYFAFSAGRSGTARPFPYVRVEKVDLDKFALVSELDIWNPGFAFSTPALASRPGNYRDEVAISLAVGGGGSFANNAVGFLGDFVVYVTTDSDTTHAAYNRDKFGTIIKDSLGNPTYAVRFGDYYSLRNSVGPQTDNGRGVGYSTLGYASKTAAAGRKCVDVGCSIDLHYVQFGRRGDLLPSPPPPPPR